MFRDRGTLRTERTGGGAERSKKMVLFAGGMEEENATGTPTEDKKTKKT